MIPFSKFPADPFNSGKPIMEQVHYRGEPQTMTRGLSIGEDERGSKSRSWDTGWAMAMDKSKDALHAALHDSVFGDINRSANPLWNPAKLKMTGLEAVVADTQLPPGWERMASHASYRHASGVEISDLEIRETMLECGCSLKSVLQAKELLHRRGDSHIDHLKEHLAGNLVVADPR